MRRSVRRTRGRGAAGAEPGRARRALCQDIADSPGAACLEAIELATATTSPSIPTPASAPSSGAPRRSSGERTGTKGPRLAPEGSALMLRPRPWPRPRVPGAAEPRLRQS